MTRSLTRLVWVAVSVGSALAATSTDAIKGPWYCKVEREMTMKMGEAPPTTTRLAMEYWVKEKNIRIEQKEASTKTTGVIIVKDLATMYSFKKGEKKGERSDLKKSSFGFNRLKDFEPLAGKRTKTGTETVAGKSCDVFTVEVPQPKMPELPKSRYRKAPTKAISIVFKPVKEWVWTEKNLALKRESVRETSSITSKERWTVTTVNVDKPIDDQLFSVDGMEFTEGQDPMQRMMGLRKGGGLPGMAPRPGPPAMPKPPKP